MLSFCRHYFKGSIIFAFVLNFLEEDLVSRFATLTAFTHREYVEKLQLLSTPEEQMKRLNELPEIHTDPKMDPTYESPEEDGEEDENKEGNPMQSTFKGRELIFPQKEDDCSWSAAVKNSNNVIDTGTAKHSDDFQSMELHSTVAARASEFPCQENEDEKSYVVTKKIESNTPTFEPLSRNKEPLRELTVQPEIKSEISPAKIDPQSNSSETEKLWYYKDPSGKIQGPFSMLQLRKWSKHFPSNLGIWRKSERQEASIMLIDALAGKFQKELPEWVPGDIKPTQLVKTSEATSVVNSANLSPPSRSSIISSKGTATSLLICIDQGKDAGGVTAAQSSLGSHLAYQNIASENDKADSIATCTDFIVNLDNKHDSGSSDFYKTFRHDQVVVNVVDSGSTQKLPNQLIDLHNRPAVIPPEIDSSKKLLEQPGTADRNILSISGNNIQPRTEVVGEVSSLEGYSIQKHDLTISLNSDISSNHVVPKLTDKSTDHSTSSTESNTVPDPCHTKFQNNGFSDVKPTVISNALEAVSPQISDASTFTHPVAESLQSAYTNSFTQNSSTYFATSVHPLNPCNQALSQNGQPNHLVSQPISSSNWNPHNDAKGREQSVPHLNSTTMLSSVSASVPTSANCESTLLPLPDGSKSFSPSQMSNCTSSVTFQPSNMSWGTGAPELNNSGWQVPNQYQNFSNVAAAVGSLLCGSGIQSGLGGAANSIGWGMMAQGNMNMNMNMPWGATPNANIAWGQGLTFPPQGNAPSNSVWGTPPGNTIPNDGCKPMAQVNGAPYPFWNASVQGNLGQNPFVMPAPVVGSMNQNAWGIPNQGNTGTVNTPAGKDHECKTSAWDSTKVNSGNSSFQKDNFRERNFGSRTGDFRGVGPGYGPGRQPRNWMPSGNAQGSVRPHPEISGICKYFENGHCKKGASCNYIHS